MSLFKKGGIFISQTLHSAWQEYEAGKEYKRRIGLYETVRKNERFYRGDQWYGIQTDLPHPVFNIVRRITDYLVGSVLSGNITVQYSDNGLPFIEQAALREKVTNGIAVLNRHIAWRWKTEQMQHLCNQALLDAAISGDGIFYCWWDPDSRDGQKFIGNIRTDLIEITNLFVADVNSSDLQSQDYIILSGRGFISELKKEAREAGVDEREIAKITPDDEKNMRMGDFASTDLKGAEKATYLLRFSKENDEVVFEKSTRSCIIKRIHTGLKYYPVTYFHWHNAKNCYHGNAPVSDLVANQLYINSAYAMAMKHMQDTAFSKVIYDKSRIPEWSNEVGEAIGAMGGGNVSDAVSVVGVGELQDGYLDFINDVIENTKAMMGATEAALGDAAANNTSAILTLQNASQIALEHVRIHLYRCLGELATIWADMLCTYCPQNRFLMVENDEGKLCAETMDYALLKNELLHATATAGHIERYTSGTTVSILDKLLEHGHLNVAQYIELLPNGTLENRETLLKKISEKGATTNG